MKASLSIFAFLSVAIITGSSCKKENRTYIDPTEPPHQPVLLKEINVPNLPSPFYHFEYNVAGQLMYASFASGLLMYDVVYSGNKVVEMRNNVVVNKDKLQYSYNNAGMVDTIYYADSTGKRYKEVYLTYDGQKLIKVVRERKADNIFIIEKRIILEYNPDGNLRELTESRYSLNGQVENTYIDLFEEYDNKVNVDGFCLLHNEFFEHLFILPGVQLQKNNPGKVTRTGNGVNYKIEYSYTYNVRNFPLTKIGKAIISSGPGAGQIFQTNSNFSYY